MDETIELDWSAFWHGLADKVVPLRRRKGPRCKTGMPEGYRTRSRRASGLRDARGDCGTARDCPCVLARVSGTSLSRHSVVAELRT